MQGVDINGQLGEYFSDPERKIPQAHLDSVCKIRQGKETCRYISLSINGFICTKNTKIKPTIDQQVADGKMTAVGDNCEGLGEDSENE